MPTRPRPVSLPDARHDPVAAARPATLRLFVALWPDPEVRQALAACRDGAIRPAGAAPTPTAKLHLTLHFIGSTPAARVAGLAAALCRPVAAFSLRLDRVERWRSGVAVLRPSAVPEPLRQMHADLGRLLQRLGLPVEPRAFRPHVTLARHVAPGPPAAVCPVHWPVQGAVLVQSLGDGRYRVLQP